ncbi:3-isopropylmalate dehydratase small subunit [Spirochaeta cellobiosiphila]|uniref:3-isopropylmalate dehydratase small subunit n=1 Tax=Spirochaeta cellobiosiphila TaxID=504483 RepID=UPI0003FF612E|nr:3-isopropylmalate dehydratase [Spirochaeta cellobiosiphila]
MKSFEGKALFLDRSDINTDEIIPAKYLTEITKIALKPYLLEDLKVEGFDPSRDLNDIKVIVTRDNFGCGSSREHAPWALEMNDINLVIAEGYARIFRQNMFNCGMMALELSKKQIDEIFNEFQNEPEVTISADLDRMTLSINSSSHQKIMPFKISDFDLDLIKAEGWVNFADSRY